MAIELIYLIILFAYFLLLGAFLLRDFTITMFACFVLFALSIYTFINGFGIFLPKDNVNVIFSAVTFAIASYVSLRSGVELIQENYN